MKISFLLIGGHKEAWLTDLAEQYEKKIQPFSSCEVLRLKPSKMDRGSRESKQKEESELLLKQIQREDYVVLCDEAGEELSSVKFSQKLVRILESGKRRTVFVIGGAYGFSPELRARADWTWSFSRLTFNHHMAQAILLEQVYRGLTIWKNIPYHN